MRNGRKWIGLTPGYFSNKTGHNERSIKSNGDQKRNTGFQETQNSSTLNRC